MASQFVVLTKKFTRWADEVFGKGEWDWTQPARGKELVLRVEVEPEQKDKMELHIYTSLDPEGETRGLGEDAIRIVLFDVWAGQPVGSTKRVHRTEGATTVWERLEERVDEMLELAGEQRFCRRCGSHTVRRRRRIDNEPFDGCSAFPHCGDRHWAAQKYALRGNPLQEYLEKEQLGAAHKMRQVPEQRELMSETGGEAAQSMEQAVAVVGSEGKEVNITPLVEEGAVSATAEFPLVHYSFTNFNRVQSTIFQHGWHKDDANLVCGTTTSSGKTIAAELFVATTLAQGMKVLYVSPLKSLTQEKYNEWEERFGEYKICILTGDYTLTKEREVELAEADIIALTSEMIDSRTRNYKSERSQWMWQVGLVVVDEMHIISTERGHAVEAGLMRFAKLVPGARILALSATLPNVGDFHTWLHRLNGKPTHVLNSDWRPTELEWHFIPHLSWGSYWEVQEDKLRLAVEMVQGKPDEKYLVFVHDKNTGRRVVAALQEEGIKAQFHNADLGMETRLEIERSFADRENGLRVLVSTSTLAWGRTLPARNVVIVGTKRGISEVDELDIIQEAGRAGRFGVDPKGDVYLICESPQKWQQIIQRPRKVTSTLMDENVLGFHILAEVRNGEIWNHNTLYQWFDRTLAILQLPAIDRDLVGKVVTQLVNWGLLEEESGRYRVTRLGQVSATLYFFPQQVHHWAVAFGNIAERELWSSDLALSYALGSTPLLGVPYVPRAQEERVREYTNAVRAVWEAPGVVESWLAADLYDLLSQSKDSPLTRQVKNDGDRITQALSWIGGLKEWHNQEYWDALPIRIKYGVSSNLVPLCRIPGVGGGRARKLFDAGIQSVRDVRERPEVVKQALGRTLASKVLVAAKDIEEEQQREREDKWEELR